MIDPEDIDETTGLPRVPKGYFWRVGERGIGAAVELRKRGRFGSHVVEYRFVSSADWLILFNPDKYRSFNSPEGRILLTAQKVVTDIKDRGEALTGKEEIRNLYGDYPPNSLNN